MSKYKVEISETLSRIIEIKAESEKDALNKIKDLYNHEKIILDSNDYTDTKIELYKD